MRHLFLSVTAFLGMAVHAQTTTIELAESPYPEENTSHGFAITYSVKNNTASSRQGPLGIIFPENFRAEDTVFTIEYFIGYPGKVERGIPVLIGTHRNESSTFYTDLNNNLDFSDDGIPMSSSAKDSSVVLTFSNQTDPQAKFHIRFWPAQGDSARFAYYDKLFGFNIGRENGSSVLTPDRWFSQKD